MMAKFGNSVLFRWLPRSFWQIVVLAVTLRSIVGVVWLLKADLSTYALTGQMALYAGTDGYLQLAHTWLTTGEWAFEAGASPVLHRPPLTVWLMAITTVWNPDYWYINWFVVSLSMTVFGLLLVRHIATTLVLSPRITQLLLIATAVHPVLVASVRATSFIQPGMLIVLVCIALTLALKRDFQWRRAVLLGAALAGAALTHGTFIVLLLLVPVWLLFQAKVRWRALLSLFVALLMIAPWTYRNYTASQQFIPIVNGAGTQFWIARGVANGNLKLHHQVYYSETGQRLQTAYFSSVDPNADDVLRQAAVTHWDDYIGQYFIGLYHFWVPANPPFTWKRYLDLLLVLPIGSLWLVLVLRQVRNQSVDLMSWLSGALWLSFAVFYPSTSYYLLVLPMLLISIAWQFHQSRALEGT